jgi:anhydro-N-acetylmuramic acid kinase
MQSAIFPILEEMDRADALATYVESIARHMAGIIGPRRTLITGGGAKNTYLIERMRHFGTQVILPDPKIIDFKEAIIFALLGYERFHGRINVLGHTTGSGKAHSSGVIFYP